VKIDERKQVNLEIEGQGEVAELAKSVHNLIVHLRRTA
jgi:hypothetical protein